VGADGTGHGEHQHAKICIVPGSVEPYQPALAKPIQPTMHIQYFLDPFVLIGDLVFARLARRR
jgi:hypothetical protein